MDKISDILRAAEASNTKKSMTLAYQCQRLGFTQAQAAKLFGISVRTVQNYWQERYRTPRVMFRMLALYRVAMKLERVRQSQLRRLNLL